MAKALSEQLKQYTLDELRAMFQDFEIENEEFVPLYHKGIKTGYKISKYGNIIGLNKRKLKWTIKDAKRRPEASVSICFHEPDNRVDGYTYKRHYKTLYVHRLVAEQFLTFPEHLPSSIKDDWDNISDDLKELLVDCLQVDHLDGNTFNPRWDNLEWVTPKENTRRSALAKNNS